MKVATAPKPMAERKGPRPPFYARHTFLEIESYGVLPKEMQRECVIRFSEGADTNEIARELEIHESRVYNHLARTREAGRA